MALGIDIHPYYQRTINWDQVAATDVDFGWVKVSDGGAPYRGRYEGRDWTPDSHAAGMRRAGLIAGGYHYAQPSPSPETQADILTNEVRRLGLTALPPALDLEAPFTPGASAGDFAHRFLKRLKSHGWDRVVIYSYTAMAGVIRPDLWTDIPGLLVWIARPANPGDYQNQYYRGHADVHQYTSVGRVSGITQNVDLNISLTHFLGGTMELNQRANFPYPSNPNGPGDDAYVRDVLGFTYYRVADMYKPGEPASIPDLHTKIDQLIQLVTNGIDYARLAHAIVDVAAERGIIGLSPETFRAMLTSLRVSVDPPA